ncbi:ectonucleoside triphosphate diphosphohydrolase 4 isoform X3 [Stegostoma tigrinum]|uniref:ectonucleoside triphosphate diphosphohydrolase 4 isoform X3 n=1 Tax=Stegostoma tigrinum TaxID=3053191 RepID=UPI00286FFFA1|nr:ectonucleoside triphosphate diphosphohydrolase 4 isoform X3 [Stegostoma tigrinum]
MQSWELRQVGSIFSESWGLPGKGSLAFPGNSPPPEELARILSWETDRIGEYSQSLLRGWLKWQRMCGILCVFHHCLALVLVHWVLELLCMAEVKGQQVSRIQLRLAGRRKKGNEGRVEVYYDGEWGTICDDDFSIATANVICKELGFLHAENWVPGAKYGRGKGRIWIDNVRCTGSEKSLAACDSNGWGVTDCKHTEDAGVVCSEQRVPGFRFANALDNNIEEEQLQVQDVRIKGVFGSSRKRLPVTEGYVQVKQDGEWKQICDTDWTAMNSRVICGMFGFPAEKGYNTKIYKIFASRKRHTYWQYNINCMGNEAHLSSCSLGHSEASSNGSCVSHMPVIVSCVAGRPIAALSTTRVRKAFQTERPLIRLRGGPRIGEGRVEVMKNGQWGTVCDDRWNLQAASVACRELGFGTAKEALTGARMGKGIGMTHLKQVSCTGFESSLTACQFNQNNLCGHNEDAAVRCNIPDMGFEKQIRLVGGRTPFEGRVEVLAKRNGGLRWGTVCNSNWGLMEAMVVCRQLGLGFADHAVQETWFWGGDPSADEVVMSGVKCSGTELSLFQCLHHGEELDCPNRGGQFAAGVSCTEAASDLVLNPRVVEETTYLENRPLSMLACAMEENCLSSTAVGLPPLSSFRRLLRFSSQIHNNGEADFRPKAGRHAWVWHECHRHYHSMEVFTTYDLLLLNGTRVAEGHKASFCLEDTECDSEDQKNYQCDNFGEQGITAGCWDTYRHDIDCQWIDVTDVSPGEYVLQVVINPNFEVVESDYSNNVVKCRCKYDGHRIWAYNCHVGGSFSSESEEIFDHFPGLMNNHLSSW